MFPNKWEYVSFVSAFNSMLCWFDRLQSYATFAFQKTLYSMWYSHLRRPGQRSGFVRNESYISLLGSFFCTLIAFTRPTANGSKIILFVNRHSMLHRHISLNLRVSDSRRREMRKSRTQFVLPMPVYSNPRKKISVFYTLWESARNMFSVVLCWFGGLHFYDATFAFFKHLILFFRFYQSISFHFWAEVK